MTPWISDSESVEKGGNELRVGGKMWTRDTSSDLILVMMSRSHILKQRKCVSKALLNIVLYRSFGTIWPHVFCMTVYDGDFGEMSDVRLSFLQSN